MIVLALRQPAHACQNFRIWCLQLHLNCWKDCICRLILPNHISASYDCCLWCCWCLFDHFRCLLCFPVEFMPFRTDHNLTPWLWFPHLFEMVSWSSENYLLFQLDIWLQASPFIHSCLLIFWLNFSFLVHRRVQHPFCGTLQVLLHHRHSHAEIIVYPHLNLICLSFLWILVFLVGTFNWALTQRKLYPCEVAIVK